jgi:pimeloyl-ACP methyl ester carboxylesterase
MTGTLGTNGFFRISTVHVIGSLAALSVSLLLNGCHSTISERSEDTVVKSSAIIFVPGFKGTALDRQDGSGRVWITISEAVFGTSTLAWNHPPLSIPNAAELKTNGILKVVPVIPGLFAVDVYGSWIDDLRERFSSTARIIEFSYDWRQDPLETVNALGLLVADLQATGVSSITLVAHSLGGLIASYYLRYGIQDVETAQETWEGARNVHKVLLAGVPFQGAMVKFRDMQKGEVVGLNHSLLDATAHSSFPASYYLLPSPGAPVILSERLGPIPNPLYQAATWREERWGLFQNQSSLSERDRQSRFNFVAQALERSMKFTALIHAPPKRFPASLRKLVNLMGEGHTTLAQAVWMRNTNGGVAFDATTLESAGLGGINLTGDGDGVVTTHSASLPAAFQQAFHARTIASRSTHEKLWLDRGVKPQLSHFLAEK